ncbi:MAG TPA: hypothetical protein DDY78_15600 [Planctomycetales bacterium]|nr:hypothetical protein [Planctomycetales bacterium]
MLKKYEACEPHQPFRRQFYKGGRKRLKVGMRIGMAIERNTAPTKVRKCAVFPVVGMGMRQQHRLDRRPRTAGRGQTVG